MIPPGMITDPSAPTTRVRPVLAGMGVRLYGSSSGYAGLRPAAAAGSTEWELPSADGSSGQYLQTNGSGVLSWVTITSSSPGGSSGQVQFNNAGAFGGAAALAYAAAGPNLIVTAQQTTQPGLRAKGAVSHGAAVSIFDVVNSSDSQLFAVLPGSLQIGPYANPTLDFRDINNGGAALRNYIYVGGDIMYFVNVGGRFYATGNIVRLAGGGGTGELDTHGGDILVHPRDESSQRTGTFRGGNRSGTNVQGGTCKVGPGTGTGNAAGSLFCETGTALSPTSGATAQTVIDRRIGNATKVLTNNSATNIVNATIANGSVVAGILHYAIEVTNGTDYQIETGILVFSVTNKAGAIANNVITKLGNQQAVTAGTLTVTHAISAANPASISINANSSLTPSTGYPRITYEIKNLTQQAIAIQ